MPYLHRDSLLLPRRDLSGAPTDNNYFHTLPCPSGPKTIPGFMGDDAQAEFFYSLGWHTRGTGVELGSYMGYSTILFALGMKHSPWQQGKLICVDFWQDDYLGAKNLEQTFKDNIKDFGVEKYITMVKGSCEDPKIVEFVTEPVDWVYFDASHVEREIQMNWDIWYPKMKNGALAIFHDTHQTDPPAFARAREKMGEIVPVITDRPDYEVWMKVEKIPEPITEKIQIAKPQRIMA